MARNIEIKARIPDIEALAPLAAAIADQGPTEISQDDTFFHCDAGRLKLRQFSTDKGELIFYRRANQAGPKESFYVRSVTAEPDTLRRLALERSLLSRETAMLRTTTSRPAPDLRNTPYSPN